jgi:hypothetical protein
MSYKKLVELCVAGMPGTNYDRFYCETLCKKYKLQEQLDGLIAEVEAIDAVPGEAFIEKFLLVVDGDSAKKEEQKKQEEEKTPPTAAAGATKAGKEWVAEDIAKLTLAINKFPAGTSQRW